MNKKKDPKSKTPERGTSEKGADGANGAERAGASEPTQQITTKQELKAFLNGIRDRMGDNGAAPIYVMSAMNHIMTLPEVYSLLDNENKEIARDIWLRIKQSGLQVRMPALLFNAEEIQAGSSSLS